MKEIFKHIIIFALSQEAKIAVKRLEPRIIGITGSVGKSSTKDAIALVLGTRYKVRKSVKSYNSKLGISLAILGLKTEWLNPIRWIRNVYRGFLEIFAKTLPDVFVLEMGVDRPKDMDELLSIVRPEIAIVTAIGETPVHIEFFQNENELAREKSKILKSLPASGCAILNADDDLVCSMKEKTNAKILTYGIINDATIRASNYKISDEGISFRVDYEGASVPVKLHGVYGKHNVYPALAAFLVGSLFDINLIEIAETLWHYKTPPGRIQMIEGVKQSRILDDSYNASPLAVRAALDVLFELSAERKIVVFGDMLELGKKTIQAHEEIGKYVARHTNYFITVGPRSKFAAESALLSGMPREHIMSFSTSQEAAAAIKPLIQQGDLILVKGSQGMRMERVVEEIMSHPEDAEKLLCRQDKYWKNKE